MKRIVVKVKVAGSEREFQDITIMPGNTVGEVLARLNLEGYVLSLQPNPDQLLSFFEDSEDLYSQLSEGDILCAIACSEAADAYIHHFIYGSF
jgi:hypothetical protein